MLTTTKGEGPMHLLPLQSSGRALGREEAGVRPHGAESGDMSLSRHDEVDSIAVGLSQPDGRELGGLLLQKQWLLCNFFFPSASAVDKILQILTLLLFFSQLVYDLRLRV